MSDASVSEVSETESVKSRETRRSARVAGTAPAKAQLAKLRPTHSAGGESTSDPPPAAAKAASKKGKKAEEPRPEPAEVVQPAQPEPELPRSEYDDSTPGQIRRAFGFGERRPPPSYERLAEPQLPSQRADQRPERASWLDATPPAVVLQPDDDDQPPADEQPQADEHLEANEEPETDEQEARFDNADGEDEETETDTIEVPSTSVKPTSTH